MNNKCLKIFDRWAERYDEDIKKAERHGDWLYRDYSKILKTILLKIKKHCMPNSSKTIIDIGAGTGNLLLMAYEHGYSIIGVEPSERMRVKIKNKGFHGQVIAGDFLNLPFKLSSVDIIVSSYAWHHLTPQKKIKSISEMKRVLKKNGIIIIADLMFASQSERQRLLSKLRHQKEFDLIADIESEYYGDIETLAGVFRKQGFIFGSKQLTDLVWIIEAQLSTHKNKLR